MPLNYYKILGLTESATLEEIKRAYRAKAKTLHPDVNASPTAQEDFVLLHEAYEFLLHRKTGKTLNKKRTAKKPYSQTEWQRHERNKARERARSAAKKKYEKIINSQEYKLSMALLNLSKGLLLLAFLSSPIWLSLAFGIESFFAGVLLAILVLAQFYGDISKKAFYSRLRESFSLFIRSGISLVLLFALLNIGVLFAFAFKTIVSHSAVIFGFLVLLCILIIAVNSYFKENVKTLFRTTIYCGFSALFCLFFSFNFLFSSAPRVEEYTIRFSEKPHVKGAFRNKRPSSGYFYFENNQYENVLYVRAIFNWQNYRGKNSISLDIEEGLLGLDVIKKQRLQRK